MLGTPVFTLTAETILFFLISIFKLILSNKKNANFRPFLKTYKFYLSTICFVIQIWTIFFIFWNLIFVKDANKQDELRDRDCMTLYYIYFLLIYLLCEIEQQ
jgi:urea transporter